MSWINMIIFSYETKRRGAVKSALKAKEILLWDFWPCLVYFFETLEACYNSMELTYLFSICRMILAPSLIRVVLEVEPDKYEFEGRLATPGNNALTRHRFSHWNEFSPLKSAGRGGGGEIQHQCYSMALRLEVITRGFIIKHLSSGNLQ